MGGGAWTWASTCSRLAASFRDLRHTALIAPQGGLTQAVAVTKVVHIDPSVLLTATAEALGHNSADRRFLLMVSRLSGAGTRGDLKEYRQALGISTSTLKRRRKQLCQRVADHLNAHGRTAEFRDIADLFVARSGRENRASPKSP